jgi:thiol-disulfide isomerase/thioredoxin
MTTPQSKGADPFFAGLSGHDRFRRRRAAGMRSCLLRLAVLAALIIPLSAAAFNFAPSEPKPVPELVFFDATGNEVSLADFRGEVVVLNLWATWCAPCRHEMPSLDRLQARFGGNGLEVIALSLDRGDIAKVHDVFEELGISSLALYHDPAGRAGRALGAPGLPTTVVIDRSGREVGRLLGPAEWDSDEAIAVIEALVGPPGTASGTETPEES